MSRENNDETPLLHQRQTKQNPLSSCFVPLSPADLETAVAAAAMIDFKEITRHFTLSKIIHYASKKQSTRLYLSPRCKERGDSGGENSNILKYARETERVHEGGSGLQKSNQKLN